MSYYKVAQFQIMEVGTKALDKTAAQTFSLHATGSTLLLLRTVL